VEDLASLLRPGDVFTHVYQGKGSNIVNDKGKVRRAIRKAKARGVLFDTADGRVHHAFSVAKAALADGFEPEVLSTDIVRASLFDQAVFGLPLIMTKYFNLGISLQNVIKACTSTPARLIGMEGKIGTLAPGADADIAIFQMKETPLQLRDVFDDVLICHHVFIPRMTILGGSVVYRSLGVLTAQFCFLNKEDENEETRGCNYRANCWGSAADTATHLRCCMYPAISAGC